LPGALFLIYVIIGGPFNGNFIVLIGVGVFGSQVKGDRWLLWRWKEFLRKSDRNNDWSGAYFYAGFDYPAYDSHS